MEFLLLTQFKFYTNENFNVYNHDESSDIEINLSKCLHKFKDLKELASKLLILFSTGIDTKILLGDQRKNKTDYFWELKPENNLFQDFVGKNLYKYLQTFSSKGVQWRGVIDFLNY